MELYLIFYESPRHYRSLDDGENNYSLQGIWTDRTKAEIALTDYINSLDEDAGDAGYYLEIWKTKD